jgi:nitrogen regulatory protein PII
MKMILAIYNVAVDSEVMDAVHAVGVRCYTKWPRVVGEGQQTGPRLDDHIWPGANTMMMMVVAEELATKVMAALQALRDNIGKTEGVKAFMMNVEAQL